VFFGVFSDFIKNQFYLFLSLSLEEYLSMYFSQNNCKKTKNNNNITKFDTYKVLKKRSTQQQ